MLPTLPYGCSLGHSQALAGHPRRAAGHADRSWSRRLATGPITAACAGCSSSTPMSPTPRRCVARLKCCAQRARRPDGRAVQFGRRSARACAQFHFADAEDWHANDAETSLMLAVAPELVRPTLVAAADDADRTRGLVFAHPVNRTSRNGVTGSAEPGQRGQGPTLVRLDGGGPERADRSGACAKRRRSIIPISTTPTSRKEGMQYPCTQTKKYSRLQDELARPKA